MNPPNLAPLRGHRSDVQVLRGLAVLLVVLYHAKVVFRGGYIGVDVFFVISGFVIGRLILDELLTTDRLSFRAFYTRRFRRLLPALALVLAVVVIASPLLAPLAAQSMTNGTAAASALFSANFYLYAHDLGGYFATATTLNPLLHTWSLAVEEQFYLLFPVTLVLAWRLMSRSGTRSTRRDPVTTIRVVIAVIGLGSLALCLAMSFGVIFPLRGLSLAYFSPFTRAWEFCAGLALVVLPARFTLTGRFSRSAFAVVGYLGIIASALLLSDATTFPGYAALLPVVATVIAIHASIQVPRAGAAMTWLGDNSYDWYLWHWPLIVFAAAFWPRSGSLPLVLAALAALLPAVLSRQVLEQRAIPRIDRRHTAALTLACIALPFLAILLSRPISTRVNTTSAVSTLRSAMVATSRCSGIPLGPRLPARCTLNPDSATTIALVGDSNASQFSGAVAGIADDIDARIQIATFDGCSLLDPSSTRTKPKSLCGIYDRETIADLEAHPRDVVFYAIATSSIDSSSGMSEASQTEALRTILSRISSTGARTILLAELPKPKWISDTQWRPDGCSALAAISDVSKCGFPDYAADLSPNVARSLRIETDAAVASGAERWTLSELVCPENTCHAFDGGTPVWNDPGHITEATSEGLADRVAELLRSGG